MPSFNNPGRPLGWRATLGKPSRVPRFDLRLALITTALVAFVTWQGGIVIERRHALARVDTFVRGERSMNPLRMIMGDESVEWIYLHSDATNAELAQYKRLFPEATVLKRFR